MAGSRTSRQAPFPPLVLASGSPRRRDLLRGLGLRVDVVPAKVPEVLQDGETAAAAAVRLASAKAVAIRGVRPESLVLAADTLVVLDEETGEAVLGKPRDPDDARRMLRELSGRTHRVVTGLALCPPAGPPITDLGTTRVRFAEIAPGWVDWYVGTREPMDKAGAYGVQGSAAIFITGLEGSWSNVVGLPLERLPDLFRRAGHDLRSRLVQDRRAPGN